jgi:hypothetical protein
MQAASTALPLLPQRRLTRLQHELQQMVHHLLQLTTIASQP